MSYYVCLRKIKEVERKEVEEKKFKKEHPNCNILTGMAGAVGALLLRRSRLYSHRA